MKNQLTTEELAVLLGGEYGGDENGLEVDVENRNHGTHCKCTYKNQSAIENVNVGDGCACTCI